MPAVKITIHLRAHDGAVRDLQAGTGQSLMRAAVRAGVDAIAADCGGCLTCATCHVYVDAAWFARLPPPDADEAAMLEMTAAERRPTSRLSCQIELAPALDGLSVELPERQY
jgi:ferredoxin, 2Fe-2S